MLKKSTEPEPQIPQSKPFVADPSEPRPIRNNNPFNLKLTTAAWTGKVPKAENTDGKFEQFYELKYGVRAGLKNLINQVNKKSLDTIEKLIKVYAPSSDANNTGEYIQQVAQWTGIDATHPFTADQDTIVKIAGAIARKEGLVLSESELNEGFSLL